MFLSDRFCVVSLPAAVDEADNIPLKIFGGYRTFAIAGGKGVSTNPEGYEMSCNILRLRSSRCYTLSKTALPCKALTKGREEY